MPQKLSLTCYISCLSFLDSKFNLVPMCQRYILDILAQCNRPKPSPTCTSSLGFSRLYILMLMAHCNTGYCTTLLHNKDVALKGFLCGCRPTRLNHVTLVFSVFLFYASPSASTLLYTLFYLNNIFYSFVYYYFINIVKYNYYQQCNVLYHVVYTRVNAKEEA